MRPFLSEAVDAAVWWINWFENRIAQHDPDLIFVHDPELLPFANWLKHRGYAVVYDAHEDLPLQLLSKPWLPSWSRMPAAMATLLVQKPLMVGLDGLMAATQPVASSLGCPATVVRNFPDLSRFPAPVPDGERRSRLAYVGAISEIRGLREMMNLLQELPNYRLVLVGRWESESLRQWAEAHPAWNRVESTGPLAHQDASGDRRCTARLMLTALPTQLPRSVTHKLFEYMALGIPVLASNFPFGGKLLRMPNVAGGGSNEARRCPRSSPRRFEQPGARSEWSSGCPSALFVAIRIQAFDGVHG